MAFLIPEDFDFGPLEPSERRTVELLLEGLSDDWVILPKVGVVLARGDYEIDVVAVSSTRGVVLIEVKGGSIKVRASVWFQNGHRLKRSPGEQVLEAKHALARRLDKMKVDRRGLFMRHAVAFPDVGEAPEEGIGPDLPREVILTEAGLKWHDVEGIGFANQGEICLCGSRIFIERSLYDTFRDDFVARTRKLTVGDPLDEGSCLGAVVSQTHMEKILSYIGLAKEEGGDILCGGTQVIPEGRCRNGWFVAPTVIEGLPATCRTNQEEIFGPVVTLIPFDTEEEVLSYANGTPYGLAASLWTENLTRAHRIANRLNSGIIWINCWMLRDLRTPFGGMKQSGVGREGGLEAFRFFTEPKNVCVKL